MKNKGSVMKKIVFIFILWVLPVFAQNISDERFSGLEKSVARIEERLNSHDKQLELIRQDIQNQMTDVRNLLYILIASIIGLVGYITWDRKSTLSPFGKQLKESEFEQSELKYKVKQLQEAFHEITELDPKLSKLRHKFPML